MRPYLCRRPLCRSHINACLMPDWQGAASVSLKTPSRLSDYHGLFPFFYSSLTHNISCCAGTLHATETFLSIPFSFHKDSHSLFTLVFHKFAEPSSKLCKSSNTSHPHNQVWWTNSSTHGRSVWGSQEHPPSLGHRSGLQCLQWLGLRNHRPVPLKVRAQVTWLHCAHLQKVSLSEEVNCRKIYTIGFLLCLNKETHIKLYHTLSIGPSVWMKI